MTMRSLHPQVPESLVMIRSGDSYVPQHYSSTCHVCNSPYRLHIEHEMLLGRGFAWIVKNLPEGNGLHPHNLANHFRSGHLDSHADVVQQIQQERAEERRITIEDQQTALADEISYARLAVQRGFEALASRRVVPKVRDALAAATFLKMFGEDDQREDIQVFTDVYLQTLEVVQRLMTPDQFERLTTELRSNPKIRELRAEYERRHSGDVDDPRVLEASAG